VINRSRARSSLLAAVCACIFSAAACANDGSAALSPTERAAIGDSLKRLIVSAYDLSKPDVVGRMMSLYPPDGRVISASGGSMTATRPQLEEQVKTFWKFVGSNMKQPKWTWTAMQVDVLSRDAAVITSTYEIPHTTPAGMRHVIGGAWTAVFSRRNGRWMIVQEHLSDAPEKMGM
jgi:hypothetical protein